MNTINRYFEKPLITSLAQAFTHLTADRNSSRNNKLQRTK